MADSHSDAGSTTKEPHGILERVSNLGKSIAAGIAANFTIDVCAHCQRGPVTIECSGRPFCSSKCHDIALPKHQHVDQHESGEFISY